jgi:DNA-binding beta-propeller fold protein YncE
MERKRLLARILVGAIALFVLVSLGDQLAALSGDHDADSPETTARQFPNLKAPAGNLPDDQHVPIGGYDGAVIPNGRVITPAGIEVSVAAPKPFGMALSPDGKTLATVNSGLGPFSISLLHDLQTRVPSVVFVNVNATFMGITFSSDGSRFFASGGENGNVWVGDPVAGLVIGSVNLNGPTHPLTGPLDVTQNPPGRFKGVFAGALTYDGRYIYVVDQAGFQVHVIDTTKIVTGVNSSNQVIEPNNFAAVVGNVTVGRYPYGIGLSPDHKKLLVAHVGIFQYTSLLPASPTGDKNTDFPLGYPGAGYPDETLSNRTIKIHKVDPRALPNTLSIPDGIQVGYIDHDVTFTVPGLGSPNVSKASSVYVLDISNPPSPIVKKIVKTGPLVGQVEYGIAAYTRSHPNSVVWGPAPSPIYVSNGNNDSVSILDRSTYAEVGRVR